MTMNENHVETLLSQHGDEILSRRQTKQPKQKVAWKPILVTGTAVLAIGTFLMLPKNAEAARIAKVKQALKAAHSVSITSFIRNRGGVWQIYSRQFAQTGFWRTEAEKGKGNRLTLIADRTHRMTNYDKLPFVTVSHHSESEWKKNYQDYFDSPLKAATYEISSTNNPEDYTCETRPGKPKGGQPTYIIEYKRVQDVETTQVIVNAETNLPIESIRHSEFHGVGEDTRNEYRYNQRINSDLFSFKTSKQVIDVQAEQGKLSQRWSETKILIGSSPIYSTTVTPDGSIWIAYGVKDWEKLDSVPSEVNAAGVKYTLAKELPTSSASFGRDFRIRGNQVMIATFVPIYDPVKLPSNVDIRFGSRQIVDARPVDKVDKVFDSPALQGVEVQTESMPIPHYLPVFGFDREYLTTEARLWERKAQAREQLGDNAGAADAFERSGRAWEKFVIYMGYKPYREAARLYEKLGQIEKARKLRTLADELYKSRIR